MLTAKARALSPAMRLLQQTVTGDVARSYNSRVKAARLLLQPVQTLEVAGGETSAAPLVKVIVE